MIVAAAVAGGEHNGVVYKQAGGRELALDLYVPEGQSGAPLVVWIDGGAWRSGSREQTPARFLVSKASLLPASVTG